MQSFTFTIPGQPVAKGRPKVTTINGFARAYTPKKTANYEALVAIAAQSANCPMFDGPLEVTVKAVWPCPKGREMKRALRPAEWKTTRPDGDNVAKAVTDGLNGVAFKDDSQIALLHVSKIIGRQGEPARCEVTIATLGGKAVGDG